MNHIYMLFKPAFRLAFAALMILGLATGLQAQVSVTATANVLGPTNYTTLGAAFNAINNGTHQGSINIRINGNTTEPTTATLNSTGAPASYTDVTIKPNVVATIQGNISGALIKLNGADNVTFDGSITAGTRDLTIRNNVTSTSQTAVLWVASLNASNGATGNVFMNLKIQGASANYPWLNVVQSSGSTLGGVSEAPNSLNLYANNEITGGQYGIAMVGPADPNYDIENTIQSNIISDIWWRGMHIANQSGIYISQNTVSDVQGISGNTAEQQAKGIYIVGRMDGGVIEKNTVFNVKISSVWGAHGILLNSSSNNTNLAVNNNFVYDVAAGGFSSFDSKDDNAAGISVNNGGGYKIHYNSVNLVTDNLSTSTNFHVAAFWLSNASNISGLDVKNNIFAVNPPDGNRYSLYSNGTPAQFEDLNYNDYFSLDKIARFSNGTALDMAAMQALTSMDGNSVSLDPEFMSPTNLHLGPNSPLDGLGTPIPGITQDIDNQTRNVTTPDIGADEFTPPPCTNPTAGGTASTSRDEICGEGSAILSSTGYSFGLGSTYQWQVATAPGGPWSNLAGATNPASASTGNISATRYYRLQVQCNAGVANYSNVVSITVNNPTAVAGPGAPFSRCGVGTLDLTATGPNIRWYDAPTGGSAIGNGNNFTTPVISSTTTFYAAASSGGSFFSGGKPTHTNGDGGYTGDAGIVFDAHQAFTLISTRIFPLAAGTITIEAITNTGAVLPGCTWTGAVAPDPAGVVIPLNFNIPPGTDYRLVKRQFNISITRDFSPNNYPYLIGPAVTLVSGVLGTTGSTNASVYYYFYDWQITTACEGVRVPITATVTNPPGVGVTPAAGPGRTICSGTPVTLTATSGYPYTYTWLPGNQTGNSITVTPDTTTTYTLVAEDATCRRDVDVTITVNYTPTALTITPSNASVCANSSLPVTVTGGNIPGVTFFTEDFNDFPNSFSITGTGMTATQNTTYYAEGGSSVHLTHTHSLNDGPPVPAYGYVLNMPNGTQGLTDGRLRFKHIAAIEGTATSNFDFGRVEFSTNNGATWATMPASAYMGSGAVYGGTISFNRSSYSDWNTTLNSAAALPNPAPGGELWKEEIINLSAWDNNPGFRLRFRIKADISVLYYGWLIDDLRITGTGTAPITWSPFTNLYADPGVSIPYSGQTLSTVYFSSPGSAPQIYTATAQGGGGCNASATTTLSATNLAASVSITPVSGTSFCQDSEVAFQANPVNGGASASYIWYINGNPYYPTAHPDSIITRFSPGSIPNGASITVRMIGPAIPPCPAVDVFSPPVVVTVWDSSVVNITGANTVCSDAPQVLTANATGTIATYQWFRNGTPTGTNSNTLTISQSGDYTVTVTTTDGCSTTSAVKTVGQDIWSVDVQPGPNGAIIPAGPVLSVPCGDEVIFTVVPNPGYDIVDVLIDGVSVLNVITPGGPYSFVPTEDGLIEAFFGINGCATPPTAFAGSNTAICASQPTYNLNSQFPSIGGSATSAMWSTSGTGTFNGGGVFGTATTYTPSAADTAAGSVLITLTTNNPSGAPCAPSVSSFTLTLTPSPIVNITGIAGICTEGADSTLLTANVSFSAGTILGYQWYRGVTPVGTDPTYFSGMAGNYSVVVSGDNGCSGTGILDVVTFAPPSVNITGTNFFCPGGFTDLSANFVPGDAPVNPFGFQWEFDDVPLPATYVPIPGATLGSYNVTSIGGYRVRVADMNGCFSPYSPVVNVTYDLSPMAGNYTIGQGPATCTNFLSFADAIEALNTRTIAGDCFFDILRGYVEIVPPGGLRLGTAALNASIGAFTIDFSVSGSGDNPKLIAYTGTGTSGSAEPDGIWSLIGVDNVSISDIDFEEDPVNNTTNISMMEFAVGLFKRTNNDGAQNNTLRNCNITLSRNNRAIGTGPMSSGSTGILVVNSTRTAATTALTPTNASGSNSGNKFYNNVIREVNMGIVLSGFNAAAPYTFGDQNNDIGGFDVETGNEIINFGNPLALNATGIFTNYQWGLNISHNIINNNDGTGENNRGSTRGIHNENGINANATISYNSIKLVNAAQSAQSATGIDSKIGLQGTNNVVSFLNNNIEVHNDSMPGILVGSTMGISYNNSGNQGPATLNIQNNNIHDLSLATPSNSTASTLVAIFLNADATNLNITGNIINNLSRTGPSSAVAQHLLAPILCGIQVLSTSAYTTANINNNTITNVELTNPSANSSLNGIFAAPAADGVLNINGNTISNMKIDNITGVNSSGYVIGININGNALNATENVFGNSIHTLEINGPAGGTPSTVMGFLGNNGNLTNSTRNVEENTIYNLFTPAGTNAQVTGIWNLNATNSNIRRNHIHSLFTGASAANIGVRGIYVLQNAQNGVVANNMISLDLTQAVAPAVGNTLTGPNALIGVDLSMGNNLAWNWQVYHNTIRVAGTGSGNFGSSALNVQVATTLPITSQNNIFINESVPSGSGVAAALRRPNSVIGYVASSDNNLFYTPAGAGYAMYMQGTTVYATLDDFRAWPSAGTRESNSVSEKPVFVDEAANDLHLVTSENCILNGGGIPIPSITLDFDGETRDAVNPDIGADEFLGPPGVPYVWQGVNTNWEDAVNWCPKVPDATMNAIIPAGAPNYPVLTTTTNTARNITIQPGGLITINDGAVLNVKGALFTVDGTLTNNGTVSFNAGAGISQSLAGTGTIDAMNILEVANVAGFTNNRDIEITGELRPTSGNITLNDTITLHSDASGTAQVSALGSGVNIGYTGVGKFVVETFIAANGRAAWRFISAPIGGAQTINQAWQEGEAPGVYTVADYGMQIVGPPSSGPGFDVNGVLNNSSLKLYDHNTNTWEAVPGTMGPVSNVAGYMAFVRGDRLHNTFGPTSNTTLRVAGPIKTGDITVNGNGAPGFVSVGNPYPSALDFSSVTKNNVNNQFYVWDPKLGQYGAYQTFTPAGPGYIVTPGGGSYAGGNDKIESGQAFLVMATNAVASITMHENDKTAGSNLVTRANFTGKAFTTRLYSLDANNNAYLTDGVRAEFANDYNRDADYDDAVKAANFNESLAISVGEQLIAVERRPEVVTSDTIFYQLGQMRRASYQLEFHGIDMAQPGLEAYLEDLHLGSRIAVSLEDTTRVNFTIDQTPGSARPDRFRLVFKVMAPVPVTFVSIDAEAVTKDIHVRFNVANETNIRSYTIMRSKDGSNFEEAGTLPATRAQGYNFIDVRPGTGTFFYRIRSNGFAAGDVQYSNIARATIGGVPSLITVYPNPVSSDRVVKARMENMAKSVYTVQLYDHSGKVIWQQKLDHAGGSAEYTLHLGRVMVHGQYQLVFTDADRNKTIFKIVY